MTKIDRYLLILYLRVLVICFTTVAGLLIVIHVFTNLDEFLRYSEKTQGNLAQVMVEYYGPYTLSIFERLSAMLAMLALLFVIAWLNKTNELTALLAAGVTKRRVLKPLLIASVVVILSAVGLRELAIPRYQDRLDRNPQDLTGEMPRPIRPTFDTNAVALLQGRHLLPINYEIVQPNLTIQGEPLRSVFGGKITAQSAVYRPASTDAPAGYMFHQVLTPDGIDNRPSVHKLDGSPLLLTSSDTSWVGKGDCFLASNIEFEMLRGGSAWKQFASTYELIRHLRGDSIRGVTDVRVQIHQRILRPAVDWTVLLLGIPILLARPDRHMFWIAGACVGIVSGFTLVLIAFSAAANSSYLISPAMATWLPLLIFFPWGWAKTAAAMET